MLEALYHLAVFAAFFVAVVTLISYAADWLHRKM